jgi:glycine oxidase
MHDCCVIGGGIIGLSIARELAGRGLRVRVVAREPHERTASWAAAGIFPPAPRFAGVSPGDLLTAWSDELHRAWARELHEETGIDNGLIACGGLHVAAADAGSRLDEEVAEWRRKGARCEPLDERGIVAVEPGLGAAVARGGIAAAYFLPDEQQIRPPRHLEALVRSCTCRGVELSLDSTVAGFDVRGGAVRGIVTTRRDGSRETVGAESFVVAAGAWSGQIAGWFGLDLPTRPIRGQIALYRFAAPPLQRVVNLGLEYLVPRPDGRLLVGSTLEDAGFDAATTPTGLNRLADVARLLLADVSSGVVEQSWAGLRPGSVDGLPTVGRLPEVGNAFIATGHFRAGLHQSTGTAVLIADLVTGEPPGLDPAAFAARPAALTPR